jgi:hypothetical protein
METKNRLAVVSIVIAGLALGFSAASFVASFLSGQKLTIARTDDVFISNQFAGFPNIRTQYSFTSSGPNVKATTITKVRLAVVRESDDLSFELFPGLRADNGSDLPVNLVGNDSRSFLLTFKPKQNNHNMEYLDQWSSKVAANLPEEDKLLLRKATDIFRNAFSLSRPSGVIALTWFKDGVDQTLPKDQFNRLFEIVHLKDLMYFYENTYSVTVTFYDSLGNAIWSDPFKIKVDDQLQKRLEGKLDTFVLVEPLKM